MKKTLIVVVLAIVLALSFATIATAKYAGYAYNNPVKNADSTSSPNPYPGYLSWSGANAIYNRDNNVTTGQTSAHGGYVSSTVKCAVCHSAHRANTDAASTAGVAFASTKLTSAGGCVNCHTAWGSGASSKKIEWENLLTTVNPDPGGPHHHADPTCTNKCHTGGVHGGGTSIYHGMNVYMLGSDKDAAVTAAFDAGNVGRNIDNNVSGDGGRQNWFRNGTTPVPSDGKAPVDPNEPGYYPYVASDILQDAYFAAAKSTATGYTCAQSGCHTSSQFAVNKWGFSENHVGVTSDDVVAPATTSAMTGHGTGAWEHNGGRASCAPCHPGGLAGGYRYADDIDSSNSLALSYGCDQCHDMVGRATNTTAWPHGNRAIEVYEWDKDGNKTTVTAQAGNLWMYASDVSTTDPALLTMENEGPEAYAAEAALADNKSFTVVNGATSYHNNAVGSIRDGVCLKCHIPIDSSSLAARTATTINIAGRRHNAYIDASGKPAGSGWDAAAGVFNSRTIFLYK